MTNRADYLELGGWNAVCFECGRKRKSSQLRRHWQGYWVCAEHWEPRQPQDFVRAQTDQQAVPWSQPPSDTYVARCTPQGLSAVPGESQPGCMVPGYLSPMYVDDYFTT